MRFFSSLVAFVYLGFVAAAVLPTAPPTHPTTTLSVAHVPSGTPGLGPRDGTKGNTGKAPVPVTSVASDVIGAAGKGGSVAGVTSQTDPKISGRGNALPLPVPLPVTTGITNPLGGSGSGANGGTGSKTGKPTQTGQAGQTGQKRDILARRANIVDVKNQIDPKVTVRAAPPMPSLPTGILPIPSDAP